MPKPKMQLFVIDGKSLFRDENNADEEHFVRADHRERYDQETLRQKSRTQQTIKKSHGEREPWTQMPKKENSEATLTTKLSDEK